MGNAAAADPDADIDGKNRELAILAALTMREQRAEDIVVIDLRELADYADYFVIGSATSLARMRGVCRRVETALAGHGGRRLNRPGGGAAWALADFGDIVVHVFDRAAREFYRLEDLWGDAPRVEWESRIKKAAPPGRTGARTEEAWPPTSN